MRKLVAVTLGSVACLVTLASSATADDRSEVVQFKTGATSAAKSGAIKGYDGINYALGAKAGQAMSILFKPSNSSCYFNVYGPKSGAEAIFNGSSSGNEFSKNLDVTGSYRAQVYLMRNAARRNESCRYTITFEITG